MLFVAFVEGVLEVKQGCHQAQWQARSVGVGNTATDNRRDTTKQIEILYLLALANLARKALGDGSFNFLPGHASAVNSTFSPYSSQGRSVSYASMLIHT